jgi:hypothetical protein
MALTEFQREILRFLAPSRLERESYVAGGAALNTQILAPRRSRDIDLFHDTIEAVAKTVESDRALMEGHGFTLQFVREAPTFAEAVVKRGDQATLIQWVFDSAYRFFPLVTDEVLGLALHPFDLATNKVLAMAGRLEVRDFIDLISCCEHIQPLGYLVWAACGKDPGFGPPSLLQEIRRGGRYSQVEIDLLDFEGTPPNAGEVSRQWRQQLQAADAICELLPVESVGAAVVTDDGELCCLDAPALKNELKEKSIRFHQGTIGGAWPVFP